MLIGISFRLTPTSSSTRQTTKSAEFPEASVAVLERLKGSQACMLVQHGRTLYS